MDNDKAFAAFAFLVAAGLTTVLAICIGLGITSLPAPLVLAEHVLLSLLIRGAYKGIGGFKLSDWTIAAGHEVEVVVRDRFVGIIGLQAVISAGGAPVWSNDAFYFDP